MDFIHALVLGLIQGITEFLPVSSSAHLVVTQHFFQLPSDLFFDLLLHIGTLIAIFLFFRRQLVKEPKTLPIPALIVALLGTAILGFPLKAVAERAFSSISFVGFALCINGIILILGQKAARRGKDSPLTLSKAFFIGLAQAVALFPGISRAGTTIVTGISLGLTPARAATFSFLLAIPTIAGAFIVKLPQAPSQPLWSLWIVGLTTSFVIGWLSLKVFFHLLGKQHLKGFGYYTLMLGLSILALVLIR